MVGGLGAIVCVGLVGCDSKTQTQDAFSKAAQTQGAFVVIQETAANKYEIVDEYPSNETRVILKDLNGNEKILSQAELDELVKKEATNIEQGTSSLTNSSISSGGLSLGEAILSSAAGAIIGSWIGSKLFNNPSYQQQRQNAYKNPSAYQRSVNSFNKANQSGVKSSGAKKSGFFGGSSTSKSFGG